MENYPEPGCPDVLCPSFHPLPPEGDPVFILNAPLLLPPMYESLKTFYSRLLFVSLHNSDMRGAPQRSAAIV